MGDDQEQEQTERLRKKIETKFKMLVIKEKESTRIIDKSSHHRWSMKKGVLRNFAKFTGKHLCQSLFFKKETLAQVFSCTFCEISKNTLFTKHLWTTVSK